MLLQKRLAGARTHKKHEADHNSGGSDRKGPNSKYVDDQNFGVKLSQIVGSGMLSQEQLKRASIQNVSQMFNVQGAKTPEEKQEIYFYFQRMMLEGMIRGVDITKDLPKQGNRFSVTITDGNVPYGSGDGVIGLATQRGVYLKGSFWRNKDDAQKLALFYHEVGHELMNKAHEGEGMMKSGGNSNSARTIKSSRQAYDQYMNNFFDSSSSRGFSHLRTPVQKNHQAEFDPSWFPAATGVDSGYTPGGVYNGGDTNNQTNNAYTYNTFVPPTVGGAAQLSQGTQSLSPSQSSQAPQQAPSGGEADVAAPSSNFSSSIQSMAESGNTPGPALQNFGNITNRAG